eukprot:1557641-Prymnesium_polylepis.1
MPNKAELCVVLAASLRRAAAKLGDAAGVAAAEERLGRALRAQPLAPTHRLEAAGDEEAHAVAQ